MADLPKTMKAIQVMEYNKPYQINDVPVPDPSKLSPYDLLVKIAVASNCHTDSMVLSGVFPADLPQTASHEGAGTVVATGSAAANSYAPGDRVMCGIPFNPCGQCRDCTGPESLRHYCGNIDGHTGVNRDGCFAEYALVDARTSTKLPDAVSFLSAAPLACAGRTIWRGVLQTELKAGQWVAIVGSGGGLGHLGIQFAKALGLKVVGVDARDEGLALSREHGSDVVVDARKGKDVVVAEVQEATGGEGVDASITISDAADAAALACAMTRMHGTMIQIAQPDEVQVPFREFIFRDIRVKGSLICSPDESTRMMETIAEHGIKAKTVRFDGLDSIEELLELVHGGKIQGKACIVVDPEQMEHEKKIGAKY
ncbi:GroES-like protein [Polychaeton citri CBS 116435]|uniref:GroES-like protein n=1 Tax=Polychaeton citri CBS 116435 TaxID=1314669 RepID=A0A9P4Q8R4_9PEZI|nr:GroES-like protein [Polychaeton citri CBS 116435]